MAAEGGAGKLEAWEQEVLLGHRWGGRGEGVARAELERLRGLARAAGPLDENARALAGQVMGPEICNWRLDEMIGIVCEAIGDGRPVEGRGTGHMTTMTPERYRKVWAYALALRKWQHDSWRSGFAAALAACDPNGHVERHVAAMLGESDALKALYVERACLALDAMLGERYPEGSAQALAHAAAVAAVEAKIRERDPEARILGAMKEYRGGEFLAYANLELCHHKFFRRLDILLSSIGSGEWRGAMRQRGTDGLRRAEAVERRLAAIEAWLTGKAPASEIAKDIARRLGERNATKAFLASLLVSLLRSQALSARERAEKSTARKSQRHQN